MTREEFNQLKLADKRAYLGAEGVYLAAREIPSYRIYLFSFRNHYVEMHLHAATNQMMWIEIQTNESIISEYLDQISLRDLF